MKDNHLRMNPVAVDNEAVRVEIGAPLLHQRCR